jgi:hypothetical protein
MYKIDKNIPIPKGIHGGGPPCKYPFDDMEVGDSFLIPCTREEKGNIQSAVNASMKRVPHMRFTTKYVTKGIRVWRIV